MFYHSGIRYQIQDIIVTELPVQFIKKISLFVLVETLKEVKPVKCYLSIWNFGTALLPFCYCFEISAKFSIYKILFKIWYFLKTWKDLSFLGSRNGICELGACYSWFILFQFKFWNFGRSTERLETRAKLGNWSWKYSSVISLWQNIPCRRLSKLRNEKCFRVSWTRSAMEVNRKVK